MVLLGVVVFRVYVLPSRIISECFNALISKCFNALMSECFNALMSECFNALMSKCFNAPPKKVLLINMQSLLHRPLGSARGPMFVFLFSI